ncbi:magnesium and cobalt transport protein CorA [Pedobacter yulinensis]|uniref:Magnesium transport protein CorA n=1 Tax=Pedobacter yulinensis TaxID=2126353 RepID=A0A2T3HKH3_9SPHI|nr:magnesium/cobalt transporter CorA [Pedobacter yulinensis]PST82955.1 magnesium and cobalt transport protein CorA [Pedobacter yulinensis]
MGNSTTTSVRNKRRSYSLPAPGSSPGLVHIPEDALKSKISLYVYNEKSFDVMELTNLDKVAELSADKKNFYWFDIKGLGTAKVFDTLNKHFKVSRLVLEDITRTYHRPAFEEYDAEGYIFAVSRMLRFDSAQNLENEQVSFIVTDRVLVTLQENYEDCLEPVRKRLEVGRGNIRIGGSSYLMYAIMDAIVDHYFVLLNAWSEGLDSIEDRLYARPDRQIMFDTQTIKRSLISIRRVAWPERDKLNDIIRSDSPLISDQTRLYVKDAYDHCVQIIDLIESLKEIAVANVDMYLSIISNRMNEIMKVLTIISSIFIPLTFIAGIYGMNFSREDPVTGKVLKENMPELYAEHGYLYTLIVMAVIAIAQIIYFWRKGWFR